MLLKRAPQAIPNPPHEASELFSKIEKEFEEFIDHNELGLALEELEELGNLVPCRGGFWRDLERAAITMELMERAQTYRSRFLSTRPVVPER